MIKLLLDKLIAKQKDLILEEMRQWKGFMALFMKHQNIGEKWTREEKKQLRIYLKHLSIYFPVFVLFLLPGGIIILPILAEILDRRKEKRPSA